MATMEMEVTSTSSSPPSNSNPMASSSSNSNSKIIKTPITLTCKTPILRQDNITLTMTPIMEMEITVRSTSSCITKSKSTPRSRGSNLKVINMTSKTLLTLTSMTSKAPLTVTTSMTSKAPLTVTSTAPCTMTSKTSRAPCTVTSTSSKVQYLTSNNTVWFIVKRDRGIKVKDIQVLLKAFKFSKFTVIVPREKNQSEEEGLALLKGFCFVHLIKDSDVNRLISALHGTHFKGGIIRIVRIKPEEQYFSISDQKLKVSIDRFLYDSD